MTNPKPRKEWSAPIPIFLGIGSFQALAMFRRGLFYAYLSIFLRYYLGLSVTETTLFATLPMVANIAAQTFLWGRISDRRQIRRTLILWGELTGGIGTILIWLAYILADSPFVAGYVIIFGLTVVEVFWSMSNLGWSALISDLYPEKKRNEVLGRLSSIGGLGRLAGIWFGGLMYDGIGRMYDGWGFNSGALFFAAAGVMFISMIPIRYLPEGGIAKPDTDPADCDAQCQKTSIKLYVVFLIAMTFINFGRNCVAIIQSQYLFLDSGFNVSSRVLSYIFNTESAAIIIFGLLAGSIGRLVGNGRAVCLGATASVAYLLLFVVSEHLWSIYLASFLRGAGEVTILAASYATASILIPPEKRGKLFAYFNATLFLSWGIAGTLIAGPVVDILESIGATQIVAYKGAYLAALTMTLIGVAIQVFLVFVMMPRAGITRAVTEAY
ncbi:MAG: MFS transporter [Desulfosalsimonas sp.]